MPRRASTTDSVMRMAVAACWVATCSACLLHGGRAAVRPRAAPRLATASADLELEMAWCARIVREAADMLAEACVDTYLEPPCSTYGLCVPASCVLYAEGSGQLVPGAALLYQPRAYRGTTGGGGCRRGDAAARVRDDAGAVGHGAGRRLRGRQVVGMPRGRPRGLSGARR